MIHQRNFNPQIARESGAKQLTCDLCGYHAELKVILEHHMASRHQQVEMAQRKFKCSVVGCSKSFENKKGLASHHRHVHQRHSKVNQMICKL